METGKMSPESRRMKRERRTIEVMIGLYCRSHHKRKVGLCNDCSELLSYTMARLYRCRFKEDKPTCLQCQVHCYKPRMRERVREVMRYSGPRMLLRHPVLAVAHLRDGRRKVVGEPNTKGND